ncbi:MAG: amino acid ABC transporter substrate-binding protein [Deltaproteobacteria bacterium]|nr:amino acid ABC transporter substrate-binding protein [Deltaproteobacteria bacterium]
MKSWGKWSKMILIFGLVFGLLISLNKGAFAKDVIKFGCAMSFTGKKSRTGKLYIDSLKLAAEAINKSGGIKVGNKSYNIEIKFYDDKSDPAESAKLIEKLVTEDKVNFLLGPYSSGITIPDSIVAQRYKIPMVEGGGASGKIFSRHNPYIFGTLPAAGQYFRTTLEMLLGFKPKPKTIALIYGDDKFDISVAKGAKKIAEKLGLKVVLYEKISEGSADFNTILTKVKAKAPDALLMAGHTEGGINLVQQAKELNVNVKMISLTVGPSEADFRKSLGKDAEYIFGVASWSPQMNFKGIIFKNTKEFVKIFKERYKYDPDYHNASAVAELAVFKSAIERAGTLDPQKVRDAIAKTKIETIYGPVEFNPNGQIKGSSVVLQIQGGQVYQVYPKGTKKPIYPMPKWKDR